MHCHSSSHLTARRRFHRCARLIMLNQPSPMNPHRFCEPPDTPRRDNKWQVGTWQVHTTPTTECKRAQQSHRSSTFAARMGAKQSRRTENDTSPGESDSSWMNRVQVKPSEMLVARLQQASNGAEAQQPEPSALEEDQTKQQEARSQAVRREREEYLRDVRREEVRADNTAVSCSFVEYARSSTATECTALLLSFRVCTP